MIQVSWHADALRLFTASVRICQFAIVRNRGDLHGGLIRCQIRRIRPSGARLAENSWARLVTPLCPAIAVLKDFFFLLLGSRLRKVVLQSGENACALIDDQGTNLRRSGAAASS